MPDPDCDLCRSTQKQEPQSVRGAQLSSTAQDECCPRVPLETVLWKGSTAIKGIASSVALTGKGLRLQGEAVSLPCFSPTTAKAGSFKRHKPKESDLLLRSQLAWEGRTLLSPRRGRERGTATAPNPSDI